MRKELELTEQIERYLQGQLSGTEKTAFEEQMAGDPALREAVQLQRQLIMGIERATLKQKVQQAGKRFNTIRRFTR